MNSASSKPAKPFLGVFDYRGAADAPDLSFADFIDSDEEKDRPAATEIFSKKKRGRAPQPRLFGCSDVQPTSHPIGPMEADSENESPPKLTKASEEGGYTGDWTSCTDMQLPGFTDTLKALRHAAAVAKSAKDALQGPCPSPHHFQPSSSAQGSSSAAPHKTPSVPLHITLDSDDDDAPPAPLPSNPNPAKPGPTDQVAGVRVGVRVGAEDGSVVAPPVPVGGSGDGEGSITVKVRGKDHEEKFKMKKSDPFSKLLAGYCKKRSLDPSRVKLVFDGEHLNLASTPKDADIEDSDIIEAW